MRTHNATGLPCAEMFGLARGAEMVEMVERTTGEACPCKRSMACPLMPSTATMLEVVTSRQAC